MRAERLCGDVEEVKEEEDEEDDEDDELADVSFFFFLWVRVDLIFDRKGNLLSVCAMVKQVS